MPELIDRYATMDAIPAPTDADEAEYYEKVCDAIETMPTIEAEPVRHGRWIEETEPDENGNVTAMCNQCYHTDEHCKNIKIPYCWYCGARMDGGADNG